MRRNLKIQAILLIFLLVGAGVRATDGTDPLPWQADANRAWQAAQTNRRPLLLYFTMAGCVYCRKMEKETLANREVAADIHEKFVAANLAAEENPALTKKLGIRAFPTTVILSPRTGIIDLIPGYVGPGELRTRLRVAAEKEATLKR